MSFRFNFSHDSDDELQHPGDAAINETDSPFPLEEFPENAYLSNSPRCHALSALVETLPSNISYSILNIPASNKSITIPKRELYDVRMQLMSEDQSILASDDIQSDSRSSEGKLRDKTVNEENDIISITLGNEDIRTATYEGGLKTWESSLDLVSHLASDNSSSTTSFVLGKKSLKIAELGCGTALPSLFLFQQTLFAQSSEVTSPLCNIDFTLADYNFDVLRLITLPNIFLSWLLMTNSTSLVCHPNGTGDLHVTPELKFQFMADLEDKNISIHFVSGSWCPELVSMMTMLLSPSDSSDSSHSKKYYDLVLASETIYSPITIPAFTRVLLSLLRPPSSENEAGGRGKGLIAAKHMYFGVGGGIAEFLATVESIGGKGIWKSKMVKEVMEGAGVGRGVWEINR